MKTLLFIDSVDAALAESGLGFVSAIVDVALTFIIAWLLVKLIDVTVRRILKRRRHAQEDIRARRLDTAATLVISVAKYVIYFLAVAAAIGQVGLTASMTSLLTAAGIGGIVIGIGAQSLVKDVVSGFFMLFEDQYSVGDYITAADITGTVEAIALRTTTLRSYTGELTVIPNGSITALTNYSRTETLAVVDVPVAAGEDIRRALEIMMEQARAYHDELGDIAAGEPQALGAAKAEGGAVTLRVVMLVKPLEHWGVQRELTARIVSRFNEAGVAMPYTHIAITGTGGNVAVTDGNVADAGDKERAL